MYSIWHSVRKWELGHRNPSCYSLLTVNSKHKSILLLTPYSQLKVEIHPVTHSLQSTQSRNPSCYSLLRLNSKQKSILLLTPYVDSTQNINSSCYSLLGVNSAQHVYYSWLFATFHKLFFKTNIYCTVVWDHCVIFHLPLLYSLSSFTTLIFHCSIACHLLLLYSLSSSTAL